MYGCHIFLATPSVRKYKAVRAKNPKILEIRKNNIISSSTQPKEEFPCAFCWDSLKLRGSRIFTQTRATNKKKQRKKLDGKRNKSNFIYFQKIKNIGKVLWKERQLIVECSRTKDKWNSDRKSNEPDVLGLSVSDFRTKNKNN